MSNQKISFKAEKELQVAILQEKASGTPELKSLEKELRAQKSEMVSLENELQAKLREAKVTVMNTRERANTIIEKAKEEVEGYVLREKAELFKLYPNLKEYKPGDNQVNEKYIKSFSVRGNKIRVKMQNDTGYEIGPDVKIIFLNKEGFITKNYTVFWFFSRIKPGETRFDEGNVEFKYGEPVYYSIEFGD